MPHLDSSDYNLDLLMHNILAFISLFHYLSSHVLLTYCCCLFRVKCVICESQEEAVEREKGIIRFRLIINHQVKQRNGGFQ